MAKKINDFWAYVFMFIFMFLACLWFAFVLYLAGV